MFYDLIFLTVFCIWVVWFLATRKHNLHREGWMYLYKTQLGVKYIEKFSKKYSNFLKMLQYPIVVLGWALMAGIVFLLGQTVYIYAKYPQITQIIKAPPVMPLIPYFPQIFGVENFLPDFYFMYFLLALLIVAIVHEFSHGIYMRLFGVRIKSTGFAFLGPILGAFVEQDDKDFRKKKRFEQMVVLAAGVFANILFSLIFFFILVLFFSASYSPQGYIFDNYAYGPVQTSEISSYAAINENLTQVMAYNQSYFYLGNVSSLLKTLNNSNVSGMLLYADSPAMRAQIKGIIIEMNGIRIKNRADLSFYLQSVKPGDNITMKTNYNGTVQEYNITLAKNPYDDEKAFLGVMNNQPAPRGIFGKFVALFTNFKDNTTHYVANYDAGLASYIYNLIWWIMLINLFVGLFNMLPLGILDGGRFFYLGVFGLTKSEKIASQSFKWATRIIGIIFLLMIIFWIISL